MNDFSWFKLLVRAIGFLLLGLSIPQLIGALTSLRSVWYQLTQSNTVGGQGDAWAILTLAFILAPAIQAGFGVYLLLGARSLTAWCIRSVTGRCASCDYDVREITAPFCPECGSPLPMTPGRHRAASGAKSGGQ